MAALGPLVKVPQNDIGDFLGPHSRDEWQELRVQGVPVVFFAARGIIFSLKAGTVVC